MSGKSPHHLDFHCESGRDQCLLILLILSYYIHYESYIGFCMYLVEVICNCFRSIVLN